MTRGTRFRVPDCATRAIFIAVYTAHVLTAQTAATSTEQQARLAKHASLFVHYEDASQKPLTSKSPDSTGSVTVTQDFINDYAASTLSADEELQHFVKAFPTIVVAKASGHRSSFTRLKMFIYSDWDFMVETVLKNKGEQGVQVGYPITVTRPGGRLTLGSVTYSAQDRTFPDFADRAKYILFLEPLRDNTQSFRIFSGDAFLIKGESLSQVDDYQRTSALSDRLRSSTASQFMDLISKAVGH